MSKWSLSELLANLHQDIEHKLDIARRSFAHPGTKGDASEGIWIELLNEYLPERYQAVSAHVVDSQGTFSQQMDVVVFDRQYSPFIFKYAEQKIIPAESVYAVFEAKQSADINMVKYAQDKVASVRKLHRTSLPIPHAGGTYPAKSPFHIYGGLLTLESQWTPAMGDALKSALKVDLGLGRLDIGCMAKHGHYFYDTAAGDYKFINESKPATAFLFKLISMLQYSGTVPMIDIEAYSNWLTK